MLVRQERIALLLLCIVSLAILAASVLLTGLDKAELASEYRPGSREGALVHLEGSVEEVRLTRTGGHILASVNGTTVFLPADVAGKVSLQPDDQVSVYGIVQTYRGEREVVVQDERDLIVKVHPG